VAKNTILAWERKFADRNFSISVGKQKNQ
jgi:hypothetical protein